MSATKEKFYEGYKKPMPAVYNTVVQELLVQQHLIRHNKSYQYDEVGAVALHTTSAVLPIACAPTRFGCFLHELQGYGQALAQGSRTVA